MNEVPNVFSSVNRIAEVSISAVLFFVFIVVLVRVLGKRTTAQLNNFDWIINITVGSLAASGILLKDVATLDALAAIIVLATCQYLTTIWVRKTDLGSKVVKANPTLLTHNGEFLRDAMDRVRVSEEEISAALREAGVARKGHANWVVLETDGTLSVIPKMDIDIDEADALVGVERPQTVGR
ncbi:MAG: YetF domain-containing protein [Erythrobacter sp.]|jgi:uncharacterized membrane protein YcaP (DUF421 family)|nr:YetF domain-containing protein [Erythrobacter sp.]